MPLSAEQAAEIAARHNLGLADAASLRSLADTPEQADALAGRFASTDPTREWVKRLFVTDEPTLVPTTDPTPAGTVPREGHNATPTSSVDAEVLRYVRQLFGYDD
jgi:hypothetical protein